MNANIANISVRQLPYHLIGYDEEGAAKSHLTYFE
jgi:hypothetical protein